MWRSNLPILKWLKISRNLQTNQRVIKLIFYMPKPIIKRKSADSMMVNASGGASPSRHEASRRRMSFSESEHILNSYSSSATPYRPDPSRNVFLDSRTGRRNSSVSDFILHGGISLPVVQEHNSTSTQTDKSYEYEEEILNLKSRILELEEDQADSLSATEEAKHSLAAAEASHENSQ
jgi:hypothetical protein